MSFRRHLLALLFAASAYADNANRNFLPFGEIESFLGNTGTAGVGSTTAVYYNPATLVHVGHPRVSVSGSSYFQYSLQADDLSNVQGAKMPYNLSAFQTVPSALVSTFGDSDLTVAYFLLVPESFKLNHRVTWEFPQSKLTLIQNNSLGEIWAGGAVAKRLADNWSIGTTLFLIQQSKSGTSTVITTTTSRENTVGTVNGYETSTVYVASLAFGLWNQYAEWGSIGLRFQSPALHLSGNGTGYLSTIKTEEGIVTEDVKQDDGYQARYQIPFDLTLGNQITLFDRLHLYADISLQFAMAYERVVGSTVFPGQAETTRTSLRYHFGTKLDLSSAFAILAGGYVIPSAAEGSIPGALNVTPTTYHGATAGIQFRSGRIKTGLGAFITWADTTLSAAQVPAAQSFLRTRIYGALITIGYYL